MVVIKIMQYKNPWRLNKIINYVEKQEKTEERLITGIGFSSDNACNAMLQTKLDYGEPTVERYTALKKI